MWGCASRFWADASLVRVHVADCNLADLRMRLAQRICVASTFQTFFYRSRCFDQYVSNVVGVSFWLLCLWLWLCCWPIMRSTTLLGRWEAEAGEVVEFGCLEELRKESARG